jgi:uncharacterized membrane protein
MLFLRWACTIISNTIQDSVQADKIVRNKKKRKRYKLSWLFILRNKVIFCEALTFYYFMYFIYYIRLNICYAIKGRDGIASILIQK